MGLRFLEHLLILTHDPDGTRDWFCDNLGFREGPHPEFGFPVHWLYIGEQDVIHIGKGSAFGASGHLPEEHPAIWPKLTIRRRVRPVRVESIISCLNCDGIEEFIDRLTRNGVEFSERKAHNSNLYQLFMREPINGIKVELSFRAGTVSSPEDRSSTGNGQTLA
jgi:catechol 2,3-dioxygenase-like lactoylglutathione lyase family enzyme